MAKLGKTSEARLATCHPVLQRLVREVVARLPAPYDLTVLDGHRGEAAQEAAFAAGASTKHWPESLHNRLPSRAVDLALFPVDWADARGFDWLAGFVWAVAADLGLAGDLRWGGDWNRNGRTNDEKFIDAPHFELRDAT